MLYGLYITGTWYPSSSSNNAKDQYNKERINGSVFVSIDEIVDESSSLPNTLPPTNVFNQQIGNVS